MFTARYSEFPNDRHFDDPNDYGCDLGLGLGTGPLE